ncbi:LuxR family transcriptional regulator, partial [Amycolatopsis sp. SID8362]|nr:LuxR family transcriptional regulator [Amycolatopsis sp. SID8362]NED49046.1 LuxR family transcriptional regulator [Amycolatopsis sp. SID8362]
GDQLPIEMRVVHLAEVAEVHLRRGGPDAAVALAEARAGSQFDPAVVAAFTAAAPEIFTGLLDEDVWTAALDQAPDRDRT